MINEVRPFIERLRSRKFLLVITSALFMIINDGLELPIDAETYKYISGVVITYILGESYIDGKKK